MDHKQIPRIRHYPKLGTRDKEEHKTSHEMNCGKREIEDGFFHWSATVTAARDGAE